MKKQPAPAWSRRAGQEFAKLCFSNLDREMIFRYHKEKGRNRQRLLPVDQ